MKREINAKIQTEAYTTAIKKDSCDCDYFYDDEEEEKEEEEEKINAVPGKAAQVLMLTLDQSFIPEIFVEASIISHQIFIPTFIKF